jgi:hypothetical protein
VPLGSSVGVNATEDVLSAAVDARDGPPVFGASVDVPYGAADRVSSGELPCRRGRRPHCCDCCLIRCREESSGEIESRGLKDEASTIPAALGNSAADMELSR